MKRNYEEKFQREKTALDKFYRNSIGGFEEKERLKMENKISKLTALELKTEKDKKIETISKEKNDIKHAITRRLDNFRAILREKLENEKMV